MAKRIQFRAHGGPEVLEYVDYQPAEPGPADGAHAIAVNLGNCADARFLKSRAFRTQLSKAVWSHSERNAVPCRRGAS